MIGQFSVLHTPHPIPIAHRGGAGEAAENTRESVEYLLGQGYDYLETDVRASADGKVLVVHDADMQRTTGTALRVGEVTYPQMLAQLGTQTPMLLEDLLGSYPQLRVNIDAKEDRVLGPLLRVIRRTDSADRVCLASFSDRRVRLMRSIMGPAVATSLGQREVATLLASSRLPAATGAVLRRAVPAPRTSKLPAACAQVPAKMGPITVCDERFVRAAHEIGLQVHVWTIDDPAQMDVLLDAGVDAIMTDRPSVLRQVLQRRGQWNRDADAVG